MEDGLATVTLDVISRGPRGRHLVLNDSFAPGWTARVDGRIARVLRANHFARAVPLPPGPCHVELSYEPRSLRLGALASSLALVALVLVLLRSRLSLTFKRKETVRHGL